MSIVVLVGDVHHSDRSPSSCTDSYNDDLLDLWDEVHKVATKVKACAIIQAGDLFHIKTPSRNSHKLVLSVISKFSTMPCPVFVVPGNHDLLADRMESLWETQPLGVVLSSGAAHLLSGWSDSPSVLGKPVYASNALIPEIPAPVYGVPWLQTWNHTDQSVRDQGVAEALADFRSRFDGTVPMLIVTHAPFYPPGQESPYESYRTADFAQAALGADYWNISVYYGHIHEAHGVYRSNKVKFANAGALSRGSLHEYNLTREVSVTLWDTVSGGFQIVPIPHKPASEVFRIEEAAKVKASQVELDSFLESIGQATIKITSTEAVLAHVLTLGLDDEVVKIIETLLAEAGK